MTATDTPAYRQLRLDSSNDLMRHDGRRVLGEYAEATRYARNAGLGRERMGQIMFDAGEFAQAAADWLSAAARFLLAADVGPMRECLDRVRQLDREGKIPPARRDLHAALAEREAEFRALEQKVAPAPHANGAAHPAGDLAPRERGA